MLEFSKLKAKLLTMKEYYILSLTHHDPECLVWWRANNSGYCIRLDWAGKYTEEQIKAKPNYYDNGKDTKAVLCEEVEKVMVGHVPWDDEVCKKLGVKL